MPRVPRWVLMPLLLAGVTACGTSAPSLQGAGQAGSVQVSLTTVPTVRSVTVSPARSNFTHCSGGSGRDNTASTARKLGFPNGTCWVGSASSGSYPIVVTNTGIASYIYVNGSSASPSDDGTGWSLCNTGSNPAAGCSGRRGKPGMDQYQIRNFSSFGLLRAGLTGTPTCDREFGPGGDCWAVQGMFQSEGLELIGPSSSSDNSTKWTVTITWTPVPRQG